MPVPLLSDGNEAVNDQEIDAGDFGEVSVIPVDHPGGVQLGQHLGGRGKQHAVPVADGAVTQGLSQMAFAGPAGADDKHTHLLGDKPA